MKLIKNLKSVMAVFSMICFFLTMNTDLKAQNESEKLEEFIITIEKSNNEIIMKCSEGCEWIDLTYENKKEFQAINEFGMTEIKRSESETDENSSKLLFTITKTNNGLRLNGLKGTAWTDLSFSLKNSQKQMINQFGMTNVK